MSFKESILIPLAHYKKIKHQSLNLTPSLKNACTNHPILGGTSKSSDERMMLYDQYNHHLKKNNFLNDGLNGISNNKSSPYHTSNDKNLDDEKLYDISTPNTSQNNGEVVRNHTFSPENKPDENVKPVNDKKAIDNEKIGKNHGYTGDTKQERDLSPQSSLTGMSNSTTSDNQQKKLRSKLQSKSKKNTVGGLGMVNTRAGSQNVLRSKKLTPLQQSGMKQQTGMGTQNKNIFPRNEVVPFRWMIY